MATNTFLEHVCSEVATTICSLVFSRKGREADSTVVLFVFRFWDTERSSQCPQRQVRQSRQRKTKKTEISKTCFYHLLVKFSEDLYRPLDFGKTE